MDRKKPKLSLRKKIKVSASKSQEKKKQKESSRTTTLTDISIDPLDRKEAAVTESKNSKDEPRYTEVIHLSSDSDLEVIPHEEGCQADKQSTELDSGEERDRELLVIRQTLADLRQKSRCLNLPLKPLPQAPVKECDKRKQQLQNLDEVKQEYSPLPTTCRICRRMKPARVVFPEITTLDREPFRIQSSPSRKYEDTQLATHNIKDRTNHGNSVDIIPGSPIPNRKRSLFAKRPSTSYTTGDMTHSKHMKTDVPTNKEMTSNRKCVYTSSKHGNDLKNVYVSDTKGMNSEGLKSDGDLKGREEEKVDNPVSECPMCGLQFPESMSPVDRDGHIASCLAAADDDMMW